MTITFTMNSGQNPLLKKKDITFSEERIDQTLAFYKTMVTDLKVRRNIHNERYKSKKKQL